MERITAGAARRAALAAQGFRDPRPKGRTDARHVRRVLGRTKLLQIDSVNVVVRSHEFPLFSRLGPYDRSLVPRLVDSGELFEYWGHEASILPAELYPLFGWRRERARNGTMWGHLARFAAEQPAYVEAVRAEIAERGPIAASELADPGGRTGPWWGWNRGKTAAEYLFWCGDVGATRRPNNFERLYDLPERLLAPEILAAPTPDEEEAHRQLLMLGAHALGVGTAADLADYFRLNVPKARQRVAELVENGDLTPLAVDGWDKPAFLCPGAALPRRLAARALLTPFDPVVWARPRTERLYGFEFRMEFYVPAPKRVYGYYVTPFLLGDRLVGRVDLKAERAASTLAVRGSFAEPGCDTPEVAAELAAELRSLADWLELDHVRVDERGNLAQRLVLEVG